MRGALVDDEEKLRILPLEQQCDRIEGVWNLSSDQVFSSFRVVTNSSGQSRCPNYHQHSDCLVCFHESQL